MSDPLCPYCRTEIDPSECETHYCPSCGAPHHPDCFEDNRGCTVFGCRSAPVEEPKLHISAGELGASDTRAAVLSASGADVAPPPPPPPPPPAPRSGVAEPPLGSGPIPPPVPVPEKELFSSLGFRAAAPSASAPAPAPDAKDRLTYVMLGIFLGPFGAHSFYAGFISRGLAQLAITVLTLGFGALIAWVWAVVEVCTIEKDSRGMQMRT